MEYDSKADILLHIKRVAQLLTEEKMNISTFINKIILGRTKTELYPPSIKDLIFNKENSSELYKFLDSRDKECKIDKFKIKKLYS
jgi:hypothetical protein